ncbi:hypothetical protein T492DRAFT_916766 [Pavlovales sp. CCMP2436]|nr:hypothetical protein T492DRAFT_916766 [Pavlovales sp. CCMP2436]
MRSFLFHGARRSVHLLAGLEEASHAAVAQRAGLHVHVDSPSSLGGPRATRLHATRAPLRRGALVRSCASTHVRPLRVAMRRYAQLARAASARLEACAESALPPLLRTLTGDPLCAVLKLIDDADLSCARLVCRAFRDHSSPALKKCRRIPGFVLELLWMLRLAASVGCVSVLGELVDNQQCVLTVDACDAAAREGHLDALTWLHSRGCPWHVNTSLWAAVRGHLEVLRYAHEHGCPMDVDECVEFVGAYGHFAVVEYLQAAQLTA